MNVIRRLGLDSERSFFSLFFLFYFRLGTYPQLFLSQISPWSSNPRNFSNVRPNLVKQRQNLPLEPLFLVNQLEHDFGTIKFDFSPD